MEDQTTRARGLFWNEEYSVGVEEIDNQHKQLFTYVNDLIAVIATNPDEEKIREITAAIVAYKIAHFATEERYFHEFHYEDTEAHEAAHRNFDQKVQALQEQYKDDLTVFAFEFVDFLEDWLIKHLMGTDKKYVQCFHEHGLH